MKVIVSCGYKILDRAVMQPGAPIRCVLQIRTSVSTPWPGGSTIKLRYEFIGLELNSWLISGPSRREFLSQVSSNTFIFWAPAR